MSLAHAPHVAGCQRDGRGPGARWTRSAVLIFAAACLVCPCAPPAATGAIPGEDAIVEATVPATDARAGPESEVAAPSAPEPPAEESAGVLLGARAVQPAEIAPIGYSVLRVLGAMMVVVALCFGGAWMLRGWQRRAALQGRAPRLRILEVKSLGNRQALYVVAYDQQRLLLGTSPGGVVLLSQLPQEPACQEPVAPRASFADALSQVLARSA